MITWWRRVRAHMLARRLRFLDPACLRCGCEPQVHVHYRDGDDCGRCGRAICWGYR